MDRLDELIDYLNDDCSNTFATKEGELLDMFNELKTLRKAYDLICCSYVNDTYECNCPKEVRERCKAQDYMSRYCELNSIKAVKDYFLNEAMKEVNKNEI